MPPSVALGRGVAIRRSFRVGGQGKPVRIRRGPATVTGDAHRTATPGGAATGPHARPGKARRVGPGARRPASDRHADTPSRKGVAPMLHRPVLGPPSPRARCSRPPSPGARRRRSSCASKARRRPSSRRPVTTDVADRRLTATPTPRTSATAPPRRAAPAPSRRVRNGARLDGRRGARPRARAASARVDATSRTSATSRSASTPPRAGTSSSTSSASSSQLGGVLPSGRRRATTSSTPRTGLVEPPTGRSTAAAPRAGAPVAVQVTDVRRATATAARAVGGGRRPAPTARRRRAVTAGRHVAEGRQARRRSARNAATVCATTGSDGLRGTTAAPPPSAQPAPRRRGRRPHAASARGRDRVGRQGRRSPAGKGPARCCSGTVRSADAGSRDVRLRLTRNDGRRCARVRRPRASASSRTRRCGATARPFFSVGDGAAWSLPAPGAPARAAATSWTCDRRPRGRRDDAGSCAAGRGWCSSSDEAPARAPRGVRRARAPALAGCGLGAGGDAGGRRADGHAGLRRAAARPRRRASELDGAETVMRLLQRNAKSRRATAAASCSRSTALAGGRDGGRPVDWFYYVNGIEARKGAAATKRRTTATASGGTATTGGDAAHVPAVVGSFPEPFLPRDRAASACRCGSSAPTPRTPPARRSQERLDARSASSPPAATLGALASVRDAARRSSGPWAALRARRRGRAASSAGPAAAASSRGSRAERPRLRCSTRDGARARARSARAPAWSRRRASRAQQPTWVVTGTDARRRRGGRARRSTSGTLAATASPSRVGDGAAGRSRPPAVRRRRDLPPARQPAARGARRRRRRCGAPRWPPPRSPSSTRSCSAPLAGRRRWRPPLRRRRPRAAPRGALFGAAARARRRAHQPARRPRRADGDRRASARCRRFGQVDLTLEALVYGARARRCGCSSSSAASRCYAAAVDPDEVLRLFRRVSFRSALTAALATRLVPVLARDARRMADAQRCRAGGRRGAAARARRARGPAGALDRARGRRRDARGARLRRARAARRGAGEPWSRHDLAFAASAAARASRSRSPALARRRGRRSTPTRALRRRRGGGRRWALAAALVLVALLPFADRRGIGR